MESNLKQKTLKAFKWSSVDRFGQQIIQFIIGLFFARLLSRTDFGLLGSITVFTALSFAFVESGFTQALIRKQKADDIDYNTVFYFNLGVAILLYLILFFSLPYIALFFREPRLVNLGRVLFITIILTSLYLVPISQTAKSLNFKAIAYINITATLVGGITGIILAFNHFGVWALVIQQIIINIVRLLGYYFTLRWLPKLVFEFRVIKEFWKFSINLLFTSILNVLFSNIFIFILGRKYTMNDVGDYNQANKLSETTNSTFQAILTNTAYPVFVQVQDDTERFRNIYRQLSKKISIITFPIILTLIAVAKPLIIVLLSSKWVHAIPYYQLLLVSTLFGTLYALTISALNARGKSTITFQIEIIKKILILLFVIVGFKFGIIIMLIGYAFANILSYFISVLYLKKNLNHFIKHQIIDFMRPLLIGVLISGICFSISFLIPNMYILLSTQLILSCIIYIFWIKKYNTEIYDSAIMFIRKIF